MTQTKCVINMEMNPNTLELIDHIKKDYGFINYDDVFAYLIRRGLIHETICNDRIETLRFMMEDNKRRAEYHREYVEKIEAITEKICEKYHHNASTLKRMVEEVEEANDEWTDIQVIKDE